MSGEQPVEPPTAKRPRTDHQHTNSSLAGNDGNTAMMGTQPTVPCPSCGHSVSFSSSYGCELVSSSVRGAFVYLDRLAIVAEKSASEATVEVDTTADMLGAAMREMVNARFEELKAEIQANLQSSLSQLKSLNTAGYTGINDH